jgi:hypothetical protein
MTDTNANAAEPTTNVEVNTETPAAEGVNDRLLRESKEYKQRAQALAKELETIKAAKAVESGDYKKLFEQAQAKLEAQNKTVMKNAIMTKLTQVGTKRGCVDADALFKLGNKELLQYDEESGEVIGAELFVEDAAQRMSYLFSSQKPAAINGVNPSGVIKPKTITASDLSSLSKADMGAVLREGLLKKLGG